MSEAASRFVGHEASKGGKSATSPKKRDNFPLGLQRTNDYLTVTQQIYGVKTRDPGEKVSNNIDLLRTNFKMGTQQWGFVTSSMAQQNGVGTRDVSSALGAHHAKSSPGVASAASGTS